MTDSSGTRNLDAVLDEWGVVDPALRAEIATLFTPASPLDCIDGTIYAVKTDPARQLVTVTIAGSDPDKPTHVLFDVDDLTALAEAAIEVMGR